MKGWFKLSISLWIISSLVGHYLQPMNNTNYKYSFGHQQFSEVEDDYEILTTNKSRGDIKGVLNRKIFIEYIDNTIEFSLNTIIEQSEYVSEQIISPLCLIMNYANAPPLK